MPCNSIHALWNFIILINTFYLHVYPNKGAIKILRKISSQLDFNNKPVLAKKFSWINTWINYLANI